MKEYIVLLLLNCKFIYIKSMFDYFLGTQKAPISWNDPGITMCVFVCERRMLSSV